MMKNALIVLIALAFAMVSNPAHARDLKHYIAVCGNGDVLVACTQPFCDVRSAYYKAREVCIDRKGASDLVMLQGPRSAQEALVSEVEQALALKQREEQAARYAQAKAKEDQLREEARKTEERRLQEEARKAEEARKEAECLAKMTKAYTLWACPFGGYVSSPSECELREGTPTEKYAIEVDLGVYKLPPGESCSGAYARVTNSAFKDDLPKTVNDVYFGKGRPVFLGVDVEIPINQALANWRKAEDRRLASIPYDCLAGICLNTPATSVPDKLVTVSKVVAHREVEVCSGRVVEISVYAKWVRPGYEGYEDILSGARHEAYPNDAPAKDYVYRLRREMVGLGWKKVAEHEDVKKTSGRYDDDEDWESYALPTKKKGERMTGWARVYDGMVWNTFFSTTHPDYYTLCLSQQEL